MMGLLGTNLNAKFIRKILIDTESCYLTEAVFSVCITYIVTLLTLTVSANFYIISCQIPLTIGEAFDNYIIMPEKRQHFNIYSHMTLRIRDI